MRRSAAFLCVGFLSLVGLGGVARAQEQSMDFTQPEQPASAPASNAAAAELQDLQTETQSSNSKTAEAAGTTAATSAEAEQVINSDVQVIERKPFLKSGRFELAPDFGITVNDPLVRHYSVGGEVNYFLSDDFSVGGEAKVFIPEYQDAYYNVPLDARVLPSVNKYLGEAAVNLGYVPIYGKFALLETGILGWEGWVDVGAGVTLTQVVPRDIQTQGWTNTNISPNVGAGVRVFLNHWLTFRIGLRDYMMLDKFESASRTRDTPLSQAESQATSSFVNNLVLFFGVSWYLPPWFSYTTNR
jgi:outer membrane beta-barrel protein